MELENKLLKDDITNKQKFIDTLLQHNSKLSQNFDISSIISVANEARKQPHEKQHYEKNDTGLNNRQKQEENKSSEKSNEKNVSNKEKNRSSEKDSLPTDKSNKNIYILGDSMVKHVEGWKLKKSIDQNHNVYVRSFSGAKVKCMKDYVKPCIREKNPDYVIFHVGTNELNSELPPERIAKSIIDAAKNTQSNSRIVNICGIVPRNDNFNIKATEVNKELSKMCNKEKLLFLSQSNINPKTHLNKSKLHLNRNGYETLSKNFVNFTRSNYT